MTGRRQDRNGGTIALAAGGTGGHLFPAEAVAVELKKRGRRVLLVTDARGLRYAANFPADERLLVSASSPSIGGPIAKAAAALSLASGFVTAMTVFRKRSISAAVGFGGYPAAPALKAAATLGIPYGVHEQNGVLGRTNRFLAGRAQFIAHAFPTLEKAPEAARARLIEVGNPVREKVLAAAAPFPELDGKIRLLVFGGSQGASLFSRVVPSAIASLPAELRARLSVVQQAREGEVDDALARYRDAGVEAEAAPFFADLPIRMAASHLVVARAGASTVTELSTIGRPSLLIPLAIAMDDHQAGNAKSLGEAAEVIREADFTPERLAERLAALLAAPHRLAEMARAAQGRFKAGAASTLADLVEKIERAGRDAGQDRAA